ncbi:phage capsid and scaffold [Streptococcus pneumoniae]|nr:phage capsid and scaffold [Streptococcus pneumoniae]
MSEEINATVSTESTETVDTQENVDTVQEEKHERTFTRAEIGKMLSAERSKWEAEQEAKMNADEKQKYQLDQREQELADREKAIARKELTAEAKAMLSERDLPVELVNVVDLTNAETVSESITSIQKAWEESVQKGVSERMKGSAPIKNAQTVQQEVTEKWRKDFL